MDTCYPIEPCDVRKWKEIKEVLERQELLYVLVIIIKELISDSSTLNSLLISISINQL